MKEKRLQLIEAITKAMGTMSRRAFVKQCGLDMKEMTACLDRNGVLVPQLKTLERISAYSANRTSFQTLAELAGYTKVDIRDYRLAQENKRFQKEQEEEEKPAVEIPANIDKKFLGIQVMMAIGDRTEQQFETEAGITEEDLFLCLNEEDPSVPALELLNRIAEASADKTVQLQSLAENAGYTEKEVKAFKKTLTQVAKVPEKAVEKQPEPEKPVTVKKASEPEKDPVTDGLTIQFLVNMLAEHTLLCLYNGSDKCVMGAGFVEKLLKPDIRVLSIRADDKNVIRVRIAD